MSQIDYIHLSPGDLPPRLRSNVPFKAIVIIEADSSPQWRDSIAEWLVQSGCRYMSAWGRDCSAWHDSVDLANVRAFDCQPIPDDGFILTTWHSNEPLEDVFWFAAHCASHPTLAHDNTCILHIATSERHDELVELYRRAQASD